MENGVSSRRDQSQSISQRKKQHSISPECYTRPINIKLKIFRLQAPPPRIKASAFQVFFIIIYSKEFSTPEPSVIRNISTTSCASPKSVIDRVCPRVWPGPMGCYLPLLLVHIRQLHGAQNTSRTWYISASAGSSYRQLDLGQHANHWSLKGPGEKQIRKKEGR